MPLIRCPKCALAYDIPPTVAVRLPMSIATCSCGEWLCGNRTALLNRFSEIGDVEEIEIRTYLVSLPQVPSAASAVEEEPVAGQPKHLRVIARASDVAVNTVFTIHEHPLWIGRHGCHIEIDDAELSIRHCSIASRGGELFVRDADSHTGTWLDGEPVAERSITEGVHLLRAGRALICLELCDEPGVPVEPVVAATSEFLDPGSESVKKLMQRRSRPGTQSAVLLLCTEGPLKGKEIAIPEEGLTIGRDGSLKVPDEYLSRRHFAVGRDTSGNLRLRDLGSRNGTFLNTLPVRDSRLHHGDEIRAGVSSFRIEER